MTFCMPHGVPDAMLVNGHPFRIVQTPNLMVHLCENNRDLPNLQRIWGTQEGKP